ncbi:acyl-CoA dehydrogenase family protein [Actinophytocola sp.]|uniref:acyl-CoA dehydrogenase family protein n=1 Tax=Actinophytocola sp. TaxID=1872138 RepID=UPI003D6B24D4
MAYDFDVDPRYGKKLAWAREFVRDEIYPLEVLGLDHHSFRRLAKPLQDEVKRNNLWAAHLGPEHGGQGLGQVELALLHEVLGASDLAPHVFGCQAPDSGNAELIAIAGTPEQKRRWLTPLLAGDIDSAFSMTEQGTGSDPKQFTSRAVRDGDGYVINAHKWFVGNGSRSDFHILMAVTDPDAHPYEGMSMFIVPTDTPGIRMRGIATMSDTNLDDPLYVHDEVWYDDVRVPAENLLGAEGQAFVLAQKRLGPGRIHHCMRWVGVCRRAFDMLCERAVSKSVHGGSLADKQMVQQWVAESAARIEAARLLTMKAAWTIDRHGASAARTEIAMIKYHGAAVMHDVLDKAIQLHGSLGYSGDMPLEQMYRWSRAGRLYDGPDEVHKVTVARRILREYEPVEVPTEHIPTRRAAAVARYGESAGTG